jgi:hypothetical protein
VPRLTVTVPGLHKSDGDMQSLFTVFFPWDSVIVF